MLVGRFHIEDDREWPTAVHDLDVDAYCSALLVFVRDLGYLINDEPPAPYCKVPSADFGRWEPCWQLTLSAWTKMAMCSKLSLRQRRSGEPQSP